MNANPNANFRAAVNKGCEELDRGEVVLLTAELREEIKREAIEMARQHREPNPEVLPPTEAE